MKPLSKWTRLDKVIKRWGGLLFNPDHEELSQFFRFDDLRLYAKGLGFVEYEFIQVIFDNYKEGLRLGWEDSFFRTVYEKVEFGHDDYVPIILKVDLEKDSREGAKQRKCPLAAHSFDTEVDGVALLAKPFDGRITKNIISDTLIELADFYNKGLTEKYSFTPILDERQLYLERENLMRFEQNHLDVPHGLVDAQAEPEKPHCLDSSSEYYAPLLQLCIEAHQSIIVEPWKEFRRNAKHEDLVQEWFEEFYPQLSISGNVLTHIAMFTDPKGKNNQVHKKNLEKK